MKTPRTELPHRAPTVPVRGVPDVNVVDIEVAGDRLYWCDGLRIYSARTDGRNVRTLNEGPGSLRSVAVSESQLFWAHDGNYPNQILTSDLHGRNERVLIDFNSAFGGGSYNLPGLAVTSSSIY